MRIAHLTLLLYPALFLIVTGCGSSGQRGSISPVNQQQQTPAVDSTQPNAANSSSSQGNGQSSAQNGATPAGNIMPQTGHITYTLMEDTFPNTSDGAAAIAKIKTEIQKALQFYNTYTDITKQITIVYEASVATADGNFNGTVRFGNDQQYMVTPTIMHEIAHTLGVGTASNWGSFMVDGKWTGNNAINQMHSITGDQNAVVNGDTQHFWPYGLNYASEDKSDDDLVDHCKMVMALRKDLGL